MVGSAGLSVLLTLSEWDGRRRRSSVVTLGLSAGGQKIKQGGLPGDTTGSGDAAPPVRPTVVLPVPALCRSH